MRRSLVILAAFCLFFVLWYFNLTTRPLATLIGDSKSLHYSLNYLLAGLVPIAALFLLHPRREILPSMGLSGGFGIGVFFAVAATLPMFACTDERTVDSVQRERQRRSRGGAWANLLRVTTITLAIVLTILYKKHKGLPYLIKTKTLIKNA